ncbi:uncharacterized protein Tco_0248298, partial [Tanacetum coccineum]
MQTSPWNTYTATLNMDQISHRFVHVNGLKLQVAETGLESSPAVIFLHGFPEIWYTWRHQMLAVADAGFRVIAPDFRGYGLSESPADPEKASFADLISDTASILDALAISKELFLLLEHMDKSRTHIAPRTNDPRYKMRVEEFLEFAYRHKHESLEIPCPCKNCNNFRDHNKSTIYSHLMQKGFSASYDKWTRHGESSDDDEYVSSDDEEGDEGYDNMNDADDDFDEMFDNIGQSKWGNNWKTSGESSSTRDKDLESLRRLLDDSNQDLYKGCKNYSKFSFIVAILHVKTTSGWSNKSFDLILDVFRKALPTPSFVPKNYYEAKTYIRDLGFKSEKIHACVNDCVLYRKKYKSLTHCPIPKCKEPRFKGKDNNVPRKVLHYFPVIPRLQRLFIDPQVACEMRWHKEKRINDDNILRHPADSEAWKHLDKVDPSFANDPRSVRLGLATDGFNPFSNLSSLHSTWPVFLVPYNLPPWKCMKDPFMLMSMLISG